MYQTTHGPHLPQERRLVTEIPGPKSQELIKRRSEAVSAALGMSMPVIVERAGGGVIIDIDGNSIIDMGAGIAVVNVGNSADRVVANVKAKSRHSPIPVSWLCPIWVISRSAKRSTN